MTKKEAAERAEAINSLKESFKLKPGQTIYCILRRVSRSGMQRHISLCIIDPENVGVSGRGGLSDISFFAGRALGMRVDRNTGGIVVGGCGMDMGFHLVYNLARAMFPDGYGCIGEGCRSNDHSNGDRDYTPHDETGDEPAHWHRDGGYAFRSKWV